MAHIITFATKNQQQAHNYMQSIILPYLLSWYFNDGNIFLQANNSCYI